MVTFRKASLSILLDSVRHGPGASIKRLSSSIFDVPPAAGLFGSPHDPLAPTPRALVQQKMFMSGQGWAEQAQVSGIQRGMGLVSECRQRVESIWP